jgi:GTP-binding protein
VKGTFSLAPLPDEAAIEAGRLMFAGACTFLKGVVTLDGLPPADRPEVCFAGRSNVGKSSLINALVNRKGLARASNTPGRTQEINYFTLGPAYLVDLPGYGFAEAPKTKVEGWQRLLKAYLRGRVTLRRAFVLIDGRHGIKDVDHGIMDLLDTAAVTFQAVLTKADKPRGGALDQAVAATLEGLKRHPAAYPEVILTSSETGAGLEILRAAIAGMASNP